METCKDHHKISHRIRLLRIEKGLSLRDLAKETDISYSFLSRVEHGLAKPSEKSFTKIKKTLDFTCVNNKDFNDVFIHERNMLYRYIVYAKYNKAKVIADKFYKNKYDYISSIHFIDYYIIMFMYAQLSGQYKELKNDYFEKLKILTPGFSKVQKELFIFLSASYYYFVMGDVTKAVEQLDIQREISDKEDLLALNYALQGMISSNDFRKFKEALTVLQKAVNLFKKQNNFIRVMYTKNNQLLVTIYLGRNQTYKKLYNEVYGYAKIQGEHTLYTNTLKLNGYKAIFNGLYRDAITTLNHINIPHDAELYFMKVYTLYSLKHNIEAIKLIKQIECTKLYDRFNIYLDAVKCIKYAITQGVDEKYAKMIKSLSDKAYQKNIFLMIKVSFDLAIDASEKLRKYKDAYNYTKTLLDIQQIMSGKSDSNETLSQGTYIQHPVKTRLH